MRPQLLTLLLASCLAVPATRSLTAQTRSLAAIDRRHTADVANLGRLKAIPTTGFPEQDILSHDLLARVLQQRLDDYELKEFEMPVDQMNGIHTGLADLPLSMPLDS